jgi:hypothetical protein
MSNALLVEDKVRQLFNATYGTLAHKMVLSVGMLGASHEYDLYEGNRVIGGITTSPWKNRSGTTNTGGQDRASTELLWLSVWQGTERRVMILCDRDMALNLYKRWRGCAFPYHIEIVHYDEPVHTLTVVGTL